MITMTAAVEKNHQTGGQKMGQRHVTDIIHKFNSSTDRLRNKWITNYRKFTLFDFLAQIFNLSLIFIHF